MFSPPLHRQRHHYVIDFVKRNKPLKVATVLVGNTMNYLTSKTAL